MSFVKNKQIEPIILCTWENQLDIEREHWPEIFNISKCVRDTKIKTFQYKILYNLIPCNLYLKRIKKSETNKCHFCGILDDIIHYFYECKSTLIFWNGFKNWWYKLTEGEEIEVNKTTIMIGFRDKKKIALNACIIFAKWFIYKSKLNESPPFFYKYLCNLKYNLIIEKTIALKNNKLALYNQEWQKIENYIT
jgi:hypothetical protein